MVAVETNRMERERTRKRPRLAWDVAPAPPPQVPSIFMIKLKLGFFFFNFFLIAWHRIEIVCGFLQAERAVVDEGIEKRHASPPRRDDDRDGHYVFNLGENLTPRCNFHRHCNFFILFSLYSFSLISCFVSIGLENQTNWIRFFSPFFFLIAFFLMHACNNLDSWPFGASCLLVKFPFFPMVV